MCPPGLDAAAGTVGGITATFFADRVAPVSATSTVTIAEPVELGASMSPGDVQSGKS
ncbi:hypothetical protein [Actinoplanes sp. NPDC049681]|uniref:hypothetical protein n=1 Tax=Actinoplanes sp. NPDC049681 TaxID=3363905 RepID=UPI00379E22F7